ncbi:hypothetical protein FNH22_11390 [Fulvivirga sp. M361]|uniref:hypothetical protein n=1 Tax=Fulvivirga sp. M361 TaxID=2594266 RepID=UPI00117BB3EC|nr:hypothetical protein [Fulvivirga sp. M361]TRX59120.1 hypothetical protein FNH22_11390 [Fulvivirga sp. M361]
MIRLLYRKKRPIAIFLTSLMFFEFIQTGVALALTSGPSQPEVRSFQPAGVSDMVDLFSGDFSYNIPLFELPGPDGGYPFNLHYNSGIGMDQEASWVGLGFNLNPGAINRQMRGLPDEFKGDPVHTKTSIEPSVTVGLGAGAGVEVFGSDNFSLKMGFNVSHNNYTGMGYSIDASIGYEQSINKSMTGGVGLNITLDPKEGVGVSPSLSLDSKIGSTGLGAEYHSKQGLQNVSATHERKPMKLGKTSVTNKWGTTLSLAHPSYTPQISMPMRNVNIAATFKPGGSWWGIFGAPYIKGFYNEQWLKDNKKRVRSNAYGYLNYQHSTSDEDLLDFNREKDGQVLKESPNLAIPSLTYDIYSVNGQGLSAMYRPLRNDYGRVFDPKTVSTSTGGSVGVDVAPAASHGGVSLEVNHSKSTSGLWSENNQMTSKAAFQQKSINQIYEPWYFKGHGEPTAEALNTITNIGGDEAVKLRLGGSRRNPSLTSTLERRGWSKTAPSNSSTNRSRKSRSQVIQPITNEQLISGSQETVTHFKIDYIDRLGTERKYNRSGLPGHHIAGFTALSTEGLRYNYGLPAYNLHQEEVNHSVRKQPGQTARVNVGNNGGQDPSFEYSGTRKYLKRTELPAYAHSYLLTSIIGADYVDVTGNGLSEDDLGYWVKFTYRKMADGANPYKWRDPYSQAHFQEGWITDPRDDKGYFTYGEKEIWYLTKAETKSHIATFEISQRNDGRGVSSKLQDSNNKGARLYALDRIRLFTRATGNAYPIRSVRFEYDYSLCPGVFNNASGTGKLTLKKLWFEYGNSQRGRLNPYEFTYHSNNPRYDFYAYDRWGNYKSYPPGDFRKNRDFPYVEQDPAMKPEIDQNMAAWSLKEITLPSGGKVVIDYESDDYAYVQHKTAMQMTDIVDPYTVSTGALKNKFLLSKDNMKIRFALEKSLPGNLPATEHRGEVLRYLDEETRQLYFKSFINLRTSSENFHEYISGYADIDFAQPMGLEKDGSGEYVFGYFHVKSEEGYHPFSLRTFQHLRTNQPELTNSGRKLEQTNSTGKRIGQIKSLAGIGAQIRQIFEGFYRYCYNKKWGREVVANKSWIRLKSPDKIKYGGGLRVRQITMKDQWEHDEEGIYGEVYEYTTEENGKIISSGVAAYEPLIGGEEIPLRYAKKYVQSVPLRTDNNLYFEYPINESYYPGARVGYSKVQVSSLASAYHAGKEVKNINLSDGKPLFPSGQGIGYGTTGLTVHEFYTARDFPIITDETEKSNKPYKLSVLVPFLGNISISKLASSQGYSIVTNDMHGRQKKTSNYRQDKTGAIEPEAISWVQYNYHTKPRIYQRERVNELMNVFKEDGSGTLSLAAAGDLQNSAISKVTLGQETEFFMDMRHYEDNAWTGGAMLNVDIVYIPILFAIIPIPVPTVWPRVAKSTSDLKTAVTNKVIFKSGILESIEAFDGGSLVKTNNLKWDKITGQVLLTSANNNFDDPIYNYTLPAYTQYQGMGAAYQNSGFTFTINNVVVNPFKPDLYSFATSSSNSTYLQAGDELLLYDFNGELTAPLSRAVFNGEEDGLRILYCDTPLTASEYKCMIIRAGFRNQLTAKASTITSLVDPSINQGSRTYQKTVSIPKAY